MSRSLAQEHKDALSAAGAPCEGEVWTIGHSTRALPAFLDLLHAHGIETVWIALLITGFPSSVDGGAVDHQAVLGGVDRRYARTEEVEVRRPFTGDCHFIAGVCHLAGEHCAASRSGVR
jgi:hypothetical protein